MPQGCNQAQNAPKQEIVNTPIQQPLIYLPKTTTSNTASQISLLAQLSSKQLTTLSLPQVIATQAAILTNYEVLKHITNVRERYADHPDYVKPVTSKDTRGKQTTARLTGLWNVVENVCLFLILRAPSPAPENHGHNTFFVRKDIQLMMASNRHTITSPAPNSHTHNPMRPTAKPPTEDSCNV